MLLNVEFRWNAFNLSDEPPVPGLQLRLLHMVSKAINKMKAGKDAGPSGIIIEMIKAANNGIIDCITALFNRTVYEGRVPNDWHLSYIIYLFTQKKDNLPCENYRGLKLQDQVMKVLQHILNTINWEQASWEHLLS